jgi:hypothetical protein
VLAGDQPPLPVASVAVRVVGIRPVDADMAVLEPPNDVVVASDNAIWFTDPGYGIDGFYEGHKDKAESCRRARCGSPGGCRARR